MVPSPHGCGERTDEMDGDGEERGMKLGSSIGRRRKTRGAKTSARPEIAYRRGLGLAGIAVGVSLVGLALGYLFATQLLFPAPDVLTGLVVVPDVQGLSLDEVEQALAEAGLELGEVEQFNHPSADSGSVVGQGPLPGQLVLPGRGIRVVLSGGADRRPIPTVSRLGADQAADLLRATGFQVAVDSIESDRPRGRVVSVEPPEGSAIPLPAEVRLTVSLGPPSVVVPVVLGMSEIMARDSLAVLGLVVGGVEEVFRFGRDQGRVVGQEPPAGTELERGSAVRLVVGRRGG